MRIGIDIDDTITDIKEELNRAAVKYAISLNKAVENKEYKIVDSKNNGNAYQEVFGFSYEELKYFLGTIQEEITNNAVPRKDAVKMSLGTELDDRIKIKIRQFKHGNQPRPY